jgi:hypothetical protein
MNVEQVAEEYDLEREDVLAALGYPAEVVAGERVGPVRRGPASYNLLDLCRSP